jgi:hypothetical protein
MELHNDERFTKVINGKAVKIKRLVLAERMKMLSKVRYNEVLGDRLSKEDDPEGDLAVEFMVRSSKMVSEGIEAIEGVENVLDYITNLTSEQELANLTSAIVEANWPTETEIKNSESSVSIPS